MTITGEEGPVQVTITEEEGPVQVTITEMTERQDAAEAVYLLQRFELGWILEQARFDPSLLNLALRCHVLADLMIGPHHQVFNVLCIKVLSS